MLENMLSVTNENLESAGENVRIGGLGMTNLADVFPSNPF